MATLFWSTCRTLMVLGGLTLVGVGLASVAGQQPAFAATHTTTAGIPAPGLTLVGVESSPGRGEMRSSPADVRESKTPAFATYTGDNAQGESRTRTTTEGTDGAIDQGAASEPAMPLPATGQGAQHTGGGSDSVSDRTSSVTNESSLADRGGRPADAIASTETYDTAPTSGTSGGSGRGAASNQLAATHGGDVDSRDTGSGLGDTTEGGGDSDGEAGITDDGGTAALLNGIAKGGQGGFGLAGVGGAVNGADLIVPSATIPNATDAAGAGAADLVQTGGRGGVDIGGAGGAVVNGEVADPTVAGSRPDATSKAKSEPEYSGTVSSSSMTDAQAGNAVAAATNSAYPVSSPLPVRPFVLPGPVRSDRYRHWSATGEADNEAKLDRPVLASGPLPFSPYPPPLGPRSPEPATPPSSSFREASSPGADVRFGVLGVWMGLALPLLFRHVQTGYSGRMTWIFFRPLTRPG